MAGVLSLKSKVQRPKSPVHGSWCRVESLKCQGEGLGLGREPGRLAFGENGKRRFPMKVSRFPVWAARALAILAACGLSGCAGYHLGPLNQTLQPRLTDAVTWQMRKELQRDGTYQLATHGDGDIVVTGVLTRYQRTEVTFSSSDILTVQDYQLTLTAHVTARERSSGRVLLDQPVSGHTLMRVGNDLTSAERQVMPLLAQDLAQNVTALLADGKW